MKRAMKFSARVLALSVLGTSAWMLPGRVPVAHAQPREPEAGRALFDEGMQLFEQKRYVEACSKFEASLARLPGIGTRGKLAECYEKIGRTASAWALYREVATLAGRAGEKTREIVATERASALEPNLAHVTITLPPGLDAASLVVKRNGQTVGESEFGSAVPVDPGDVRVEASAPQRKSWSKRIRVSDGNAVRVEVPALETAPGGDNRGASPNATGASSSSGWAWQRTTGVVVGGAGLAALLAGGYFGLSAKSTYNGAFDSNCQHSDNTCNAAGQSDTESAHHKALASTILVGAGAGLVATGAILFFTAPKRVSSERALRIAPQVGAGQAGLLVWGRL